MAKQPDFNAEIYPPFEGFPKEGIRFLGRLKKNNTREWFAAHKSEYEDYVKFPMQTLIAALREPMAAAMPEFDVNPARSMFRIYRDTRFSSDKTPYKTHVAAIFHLKGKWQESAGFYLHIEPTGIYLGGGVYMPDSDQLKKLRTAIAEHSREFLAIVRHKTFVSKFKGLEGERLQRGPAGFPPDHPMIEWLKHKSFYTGAEWKAEESYTEDFPVKVVRLYKDLLPLIRFLNRSLGLSAGSK